MKTTVKDRLFYILSSTVTVQNSYTSLGLKRSFSRTLNDMAWRGIGVVLNVAWRGRAQGVVQRPPGSGEGVQSWRK